MGSDFDFSLEQEGDKTVCRTESATRAGRIGRFAAEISVGAEELNYELKVPANLPESSLRALRRDDEIKAEHRVIRGREKVIPAPGAKGAR